MAKDPVKIRDFVKLEIVEKRDKKKRIWFCSICGRREDSQEAIEQHLLDCPKNQGPNISKRDDVVIFHADNTVTMNI